MYGTMNLKFINAKQAREPKKKNVADPLYQRCIDMKNVYRPCDF